MSTTANPSTDPIPAPSTTPSRPIRPAASIPDSQDDDEQYLPDFEDILQEPSTPAPVPRYAVKDHSERLVQAGKEEMAKAEAEAAAQAAEEAEAGQENVNGEGATEGKEASSTGFPPRAPTKANVPLPSTAAHTLLLLATAPAAVPPAVEQQNPPSTAAPPSVANPRHAHLAQQITSLQSKIGTIQSELASTSAQLADPSLADNIVKAHIKLLHEYNEIKDVGLGLMGLIADGRGVRLGGIMREFGITDRD